MVQPVKRKKGGPIDSSPIISELNAHQEAMIVRVPLFAPEEDTAPPPIAATVVEIQELPLLREVKFAGPISKPSDTVRCWWCCHHFQCLPVHLPHYLEAGGTFHVMGYFCSFNCAVAYNYSMKDLGVGTRSTLLHMVYEKAIGRQSATRLVPAPPREVLEDFGGDMDIATFRRDSMVLRKEHRVLLPPLQPVVARIERAAPLGPFQATPVVPLSENKVTKAKESLLLKRSKPRKTNHISLEETMGIIKKTKAFPIQSL